jgi:hypothetical protein
MKRSAVGVALIVPVAFATACGGKVVFDEPGAGGATSSSAQSAGQTSTGTHGACLTTVTVGTGDFGPSAVAGTKCFGWTSGACPSLYAANAYIGVDPCYALSSVDGACTSPKPNVCCYDITEKLTCKTD